MSEEDEDSVLSEYETRLAVTKTNYALLANEEPTDEELIDHEKYTYTIRFTALEKRWEIAHTPDDEYRGSPWAMKVKDWGKVGEEVHSLIEVEEYENVKEMSIAEVKQEQEYLEKKKKSIQGRLEILEAALVEMIKERDELLNREKEMKEEDKKEGGKKKKRKVEK